jgi:phage major head subunit gpT-like protein
MAVSVSAFTANARSEFMQGKMDAENRVLPANYDPFVSKMPSTVRVETQTFMSNLPRLREFKGYVPSTRLVSKSYQVENKEYRIGPVAVRKSDLDDDQVGGYLASVRALPSRAQADIGFRILSKLANGTSTNGADACFDGTAFFADSHTVGTGDNLMTADNAGNDAVTHKIIALVPTNPVVKPVVFQDRESVSALETDADTPQGKKLREFEYWADCRFGLGYGFWWDAIHLTITDTPSLTELMGHVRDIINRFRTFKLPKGSDVDDDLYVHENWVPDSTNFWLLCNMGLGELLSTIQTEPNIAAGTSGAVITNQYKGRFNLIPTSSLGA